MEWDPRRHWAWQSHNSWLPVELESMDMTIARCQVQVQASIGHAILQPPSSGSSRLNFRVAVVDEATSPMSTATQRTRCPVHYPKNNLRRTTSGACFLLLAACLFACCSIGNAQTKSTVSQFNDPSRRQTNSFELAQKTESPGKSKQQPAAPNNAVEKKQVPAISQQRRAELIGFVRKHHPAIRPLLVSLEKNRPAEFQTALLRLDREVKNLQILEKRSPERYQNLLEQWICKSKIELLSAQLVLKKIDDQKTAVRNELKSQIAKRHDLRIALLAEDAALAKKRLDKLQEQVKTLRTTRGKLIQDQLAAITRNAERILAAEKRAAEAKKKKAAAEKKAAEAKKNRSNNK